MTTLSHPLIYYQLRLPVLEDYMANCLRRAADWTQRSQVGLLQSICKLQVQDRPHRNAPAVVAGLSAGGQSGLLASLMQTAVGSMVNPGGQEGGVGASFVEAFFSVILGLATTTAGCTALASAGLIPNFLLMLGDTDPSHYPLVYTHPKVS